MKKLLSLALVVFMVMSVCVTAVVPVSAEATKVFSMALADDGSITNSVVGSSSTISGGSGSAVGTVDATGKKVLDVGSTGYAVTDSAFSTLTETDFTVEWWAKADAANFSGWMGSFRNNSSQYSFKAQPIFNGGTAWRSDRSYVSGETTPECQTSIPTSACSDYRVWNHFVITDNYNSAASQGTVTIYLNGKQAGTSGYTGTRVAIETLNIGQAHADAAYFEGFIGAFDVYKGALSATDVAANYESSINDYYDVDTSGLLFDLDLSGYDEASTEATKGITDKTKDIVDESFTVPSNVDIKDVKIGEKTVKAMNISGSTHQGINVVDAGVNDAAVGKTLTVESWMKVDESGGHYLLYTHPTSAGHDWQLQVTGIYAENKTVTFRSDVQTVAGAGSLLKSTDVLGEWAHYVFTREYTAGGCVTTIYVNGEQKAKDTIVSKTEAKASCNDYALHIGGGTWDPMTSGSIATFKVYEQALTADEVAATYAKDRDEYYEIDKSGLLFDLDLSGYDATSTDDAKGIKDRTKDLIDETIKLAGNATVTNISETSTVKALNVTGTALRKNGGIDATDTGVDAAALGKVMTVESWIKVDGDGGHVLLYRDNSGNNWQLMVGNVDPTETKNVTFQMKLHDNQNTMKSYSAKGVYGSWAHYVFTREYTDAGCVQKLYVNGVLTDSQTDSTATVPEKFTSGTMYIGGGSWANAEISMTGSIATFKVYNKVLTEAEAKEKYTKEASTYGVEIPTTDISLSDVVGWKSGDDAVSGINSDMTALSATFTLQNNTTSEQTAFCVLALYNKDGKLLSCDVDPTVAVGEAKTLSLTSITVEEGCYAKLLVWESGTLRPFVSVTLPYTGTAEVCL